MGMKRKEPPAPSLSRRLEALRGRERKLRQRRIAILKGELAKAQDRVCALQMELRAMGDEEATAVAGRIRWDDVYAQLGSTFTAKQMRALTGASPNLIGSILHRWKQQRRVVAAGERGRYRKVR